MALKRRAGAPLEGAIRKSARIAELPAADAEIVLPSSPPNPSLDTVDPED